VWRGHDERLDRAVAVKEVRLPGAAADRAREAIHSRYLREALVAARLAHPAAVTVYDAFERDDCLYLVMELVDALTLEAVVATEGPRPVAEAAAIGISLAGVLAAAHETGIVHRDVKPANVLVTGPGRVKLTDFGIAALVDDTGLTTSGRVLGSPASMAPEQAQGHRAMAASDVWSLGATLYFAVEGCGPFDRDGAMATVRAIVDDPPRPPTRAGALAPVLAATLDKDPASRPDLATVIHDLEAVCRGETTTVIAPVGVDPTIASSPATAVLPAVAPAAEPRAARLPGDRRRSLTLIVLVVALVVAVSVAIAAAAPRDDLPPVSPTTSVPQSSTSVVTTAPPATAAPAPPPAPPTTRKKKGGGHDD
jgi:serine/threonine protein kinase